MMLQKIRDNASGPLAYVVVAVIALVFGVWGIGSYFTPSADPVVASVGGTDITRNQLQRAYDQRYQRLRQLMGDNFDPSIVPPAQLRRTTLEGLINNAVMNQYAQRTGYRVPDGAVLAALRNDPQFQENGQFSAERYRGLLASAGIAPAQYEASVRDDLKSRQLRTEIVGSAFASPAEVDQAYRLANQSREIRYLSFDPAQYRNAVEVSDSEIQTYYDEHKDQFQRPARVKLSYVVLDRNTAGSGKAPDEQALRALYEQNKDQLGEPEKRSGAEIRIPIEGNGSAAREAVQQLASKATGDTDFENLASSVDEARFQPLDAVARTDLPASVGQALFQLDTGQVSSPIRADDAWYLVRVDKVTPAQTPAFDDPEVQAQLDAIASAQAGNQAYQEKSDRLESLAYEAPNDLDTLSDELGLQIQGSDWIMADGGPGLGQYDAVRKAAFSDAVLKDKLNSTPIQLGADRQVVLRVSDQEKAATRPLDAVRDQVRELLVDRKASDRAREAAKAALETLKSGTSMQDVAAADGAPKLSSPGFVKRSAGSDVDPRILEAAFSLNKPGKDHPVYDITATSQGTVALVAVDAVRIDEKGSDQAPRSRFAEQQRNYIAEQEYAALSEYLRSQADVEINESRVN
ncbi:SurA N-terminal domain-containing protein [Salinisphaera sp. T31B1]|uniref:SurA N-terminal domain-containing protein n=1 Tax=Salinisphaera sp. T31B1 TaxID=727963 RepID=UPI00333E4240